MRSAGWCAYMQAQQEKEEIEKKRQQWLASHLSSGECPLCGGDMYVREGKYGEFLGCENYSECKGTQKIN